MQKRTIGQNAIFEIRPARYSDGKQIASLILEWLSFDTKGRISSVRRSIDRGEFLVASETDDRKSLVAFIHGIVHNDPISGGRRLFVTAFYVKPQFRRKGLGSAMLKTMMERTIKKDDLVGIEVSTIRKDAARFYKEKFGFFHVKGDMGEILLNFDVKKS
jgi:ribosomal protein S18 acetylase RimI-like enzyme